MESTSGWSAATDEINETSLRYVLDFLYGQIHPPDDAEPKHTRPHVEDDSSAEHQGTEEDEERGEAEFNTDALFQSDDSPKSLLFSIDHQPDEGLNPPPLRKSTPKRKIAQQDREKDNLKEKSQRVIKEDECGLSQAGCFNETNDFRFKHSGLDNHYHHQEHTFDEEYIHQNPSELMSPGGRAILRILRGVYGRDPDQHCTTLLKYAYGGSDPLDGVSVYYQPDPQPHWVYVSYGLTRMDSSHSLTRGNGFGFELTFRLGIEHHTRATFLTDTGPNAPTQDTTAKRQDIFDPPYVEPRPTTGASSSSCTTRGVFKQEPNPGTSTHPESTTGPSRTSTAIVFHVAEPKADAYDRGGPDKREQPQPQPQPQLQPQPQPQPQPQHKVCSNCGAEETVLWRQGPMGRGTLCNKCGVRWKRGMLKHGNPAIILNSAIPLLNPPADSPALTANVADSPTNPSKSKSQRAMRCVSNEGPETKQHEQQNGRHCNAEPDQSPAKMPLGPYVHQGATPHPSAVPSVNVKLDFDSRPGKNATKKAQSQSQSHESTPRFLETQGCMCKTEEGSEGSDQMLLPSPQAQTLQHREFAPFVPPPTWPIQMMQNIARCILTAHQRSLSGSGYGSGSDPHLYAVEPSDPHGPARAMSHGAHVVYPGLCVDADGPICIEPSAPPSLMSGIVFADDPLILERGSSPFGEIRFMQIVGITRKELHACTRAESEEAQRKCGIRLIQALIRSSSPLLITNLRRPSLRLPNAKADD